MAAKSGYERLAQVDEFEEQQEHEQGHLTQSRSGRSVNIVSQPTHVHRLPTSTGLHDTSLSVPAPKTRRRSNSGIDIKAINARLERYLLVYTVTLTLDG